MTNRPNTNRKEETAAENDTPAVLSSIENYESDGDRSNRTGERLRNRLGLSVRRWELLVSVVVFLPYPIFLGLMLNDVVNSLSFLLFTLVYSVFAMYVNLSF